MKLSPDAVRVMSFFTNDVSPESDALSPRRRTAWRIGNALRLVIDRLVENKAPDDEFEALADEFEAAADRLAAHEYGRRYDAPTALSESTLSEIDNTVDGPPSGHTDYSPMIGRSNPMAPPMRFWLEGDTVLAEATFGHAYEGPPGCVHGGIVAAAFDEVLGCTQAASGSPGMTGTLTVVYRSPSPLHEPIRFEAHLDEVQGRKVLTSARSYAAGPSGDITGEDRVLCAESTGVFISVDFDKIAAAFAEKQTEDSEAKPSD